MLGYVLVFGLIGGVLGAILQPLPIVIFTVIVILLLVFGLRGNRQGGSAGGAARLGVAVILLGACLPALAGLWVSALIFNWSAVAQSGMTWMGSLWHFLSAHVLRSWS